MNVVAAVLVAGCVSEGTPATPTGSTVAPSAETGRVFLVAVDGATWDVIDPLVARGELPTLARLRERGCPGAMRSLESSRSAVIWTSVATGVRPETHGIVDFAYEEGGRRRLYLNDRLLAPPLWELASDAGARVGVTHWWVSYPVVPVDGYLVSNHAIPSSSRIAAETFASKEEVPPREVEKLVYPSGLWPALAPVLRGRLTGQGSEEPRMLPAIDDAYMEDEEVVDMTLRAAKALEPRLVMVYLKGVDVMSHYFWGFHDPGVAGLDAPPSTRRVAVYGELVQSKYRHTDALLADLLAGARPDDVVIVVSDHGFGARAAPWTDQEPGISDVVRRQWTMGFHRGTHGPASVPPSRDGVYLVAGGPVSRARCPAEISLYDVAPTVLYLLGQPVPAHMEGRAVTELLDEGYVGRHPVRTTGDRQVRREVRAATGAPDDAEAQVIEKLRALGYFGD